MSARRQASLATLLATDIYGLTAEEYSLGRDNVEVVRLLLDAGVRVIQYREKDKKAGAMYRECQAIRELTRAAGAVFIVNDHIDLALLTDADGVHVGQEDLPVKAVRRLVGPDVLVGLSTHAPEEAREAEASGLVDYIGVGPIFSTTTKKDVCAPVGFDYLEFVATSIALPFVAIGGIKEHNIATVAAHGARTFALVTELVGQPDIAAKVRALRLALQHG